MAAEVFENQLLGYRAVLGGLEALTKDICVNCITLEAARTKVGKGLKKLAKDIEAEAIPCAETKGNLKAKVDAFSNNNINLPGEVEITAFRPERMPDSPASYTALDAIFGLLYGSI